MGVRSDEISANGLYRSQCPVIDAELVEDTSDVGFDGVGTDVENVRYLGVGVSFGQEPQYFCFPWGKEGFLCGSRCRCPLLLLEHVSSRVKSQDEDGFEAVVFPPDGVGVHVAPATSTLG